MTRPFLILSFLATTALSAPAYAEITPAEVWEDFKSYAAGLGYELTGTATGGGSALTVTDAVMVSALPDAEGSVSITLGTIALTDAGDAVAVAFEPVMPIQFEMELDEGEAVVGVVEYRLSGLDMQVTGSSITPRYAYSADALTLALTDLQIDGEVVPRDVTRMQATLSDVAGSSLAEIGAMRVLNQSLTARSVDYSVYVSDPEAPNSVGQIEGQMRDLTMTAASELPLTTIEATDSTPFAAGMINDADVSHAGGEITISSVDGGDITTYAATSTGGRFGFGLAPSGLSYQVMSEGVEMQLTTIDLPFPVALKAQETSLNLMMPVEPSETSEPFELGMALRGFEMANMVWDMFDPAAVLPRDPAIVAVGLSGQMRWLVNLFDDAEMAAVSETEMPAEVQSLNLDALTLDIAGVRFTGTGGFTFDNTDLRTFDGFPAPDGQINLELVGANALIESLVNMGLLPQEQAMGARMMMSMFAQPVGDDRLTSTIEVRPNGQILANGQRLQ